VVSYNWDASVFVVRRIKGSTWTSNKERRVRVQFEEEKGLGYLGLLDVQGVKGFELVANVSKGQKTFDLEVSGSMSIKALTIPQVAEDNSYLRLYDPSTGKQIRSGQDGAQTAFELSNPGSYDMRMNVLCCPSEGDWPLLADDCKFDLPRLWSRSILTSATQMKAQIYDLELPVKSRSTRHDGRISANGLSRPTSTTRHDKLICDPTLWRPSQRARSIRYPINRTTGR
jgi:hypothetical protein